MITPPVWAILYRALAAPDASVFDVPRARRHRRATALAVRRLPAGSDVVLRGRSSSVKAVARAAHVRVTRELIALPSLRTAMYLVDDHAAPVSFLCNDILSVPPGVVTLVGPANALLRAVAFATRWRLARALLRSRVLIGALA